MAVDKLLVWAWGEPQEHDPTQDKPAPRYDLSMLTADELRALLDTLRRIQRPPAEQTTRY